MRSGGFAGIATAAALLAAAPSALAETFCVEKPSCNGTNQVTLQDAINVAGQTQGIPDRIELGKATFEEGPYLAADDNPVKIIGSGRAKTTLARSTSTASETVLSLDDPDSSVASLAVDLGDGNSVIGMITKGKASDVLVESTSASTNQIGVRLVNGSLKQSSIRLSNSTGNIGLNTIGLSTASNLSTHATTGIYGSGEIERARVTAVNNGITGIMDLEIDQATIEVTGTGSTALVGAGGLGFDAETTTARHVTMVADPTDGATGANVQAAPGISSSSTANLVLRNSIIWGFATDLLRHGSNGGGCPPFCAHLGTSISPGPSTTRRRRQSPALEISQSARAT